MADIHLLCRRGLNVRLVDHPVYETGDWDVSPEEAARIVGGMLFLHETKDKRSYFGGRIEGFRVVETEEAHARRVVFRLTSLKEGKGVKWRGASHGRAWTSGVVE